VAAPTDGALPPPPDEPPPPDTSAPRERSARAFDRVPPHSLEAEVSVLGAALLSRTAAIEVAEILHADDFYRSAHRAVFESVRELMARGEPVDPVTLLDHLAATGRLDEVGGANSVHELASSTPTAANAVHYARIVREKALLRRLIEAGTDIVRLGYEPTDDPVATVSEAESIMFQVAEQGTTGEATELKDLLNESFAAIEKLAERGDDVTGLPTGFRDLDRLTAGFQPQNLIILAARPAMGKSSLALSVAHYVTAELRRPAVVFSLEMSKQEIVMRLLASEAMIDSGRIKTGRLEDSDWRKLGDALGKLSEAPLFIDDTPSINMMEIMSKSRRLKQRRGLDLIIIDYLQLMQSHRRVDNRQQEVAEISRGLKMLAKELDVPVVALSQLNRSPEARTDKRPMLADLRESGSVEQDADLVAFIYRDEVYNEDSPDRGIAELLISKHRNGQTGVIKLAFLGHVTKFANLARGAMGGGPGGAPPPPPPAGPGGNGAPL
jgi:replicative DNA helicase